jgi:hypothetical protein
VRIDPQRDLSYPIWFFGSQTTQVRMYDWVALYFVFLCPGQIR